MKRIGNIYEKLIDKDNILAAIKKASAGKRHRESVQRVLADIPGHVDQIHALLKNKTYKPCRVQEKTVKEGARQKERKITTIKFFPDQIIHWCAVLQIQDAIMKSAYQLSCGSMPGRGTHYARNFVARWMQRDRKNTKYVAKLDVSKFYPSIPHEQVKASLRRKFKDSDLLWLLDSIIGHWSRDKKEQDKTGLPIGFLTSQWFANLLLQPIDYRIKQVLGAKYYIRYMDDMIVFGRNKKQLHRITRDVSAQLSDLGLKLKDNWQIFQPETRPVDFMGFRFHREKITLRRSLMLRITRRCRKVLKKHNPGPHESSSVLSYMGWIKYSNSYGMFNRRIKPFVNIKKAKQCVSAACKAASQITKGNTNENCAIRVA